MRCLLYSNNKNVIQIKFLIETKTIVSLPWENLHYKISREKLEPEPGFDPRTSYNVKM